MPRDRRLLRWLQGLRPRRDRNASPAANIAPPADTVPLAHSRTPKPVDRSTANPDSSKERGIDIEIDLGSVETAEPAEMLEPDIPPWLDRLRPKQLENQLNQQFQQFQARQLEARQQSRSDIESNQTNREPLATQFDRILANLPSLPQLPQFDRADIERRFETFARNAKPEDIGQILKRLPDMNRGPMREIWPKVRSLLEMIRDPSAAWTAKALAIGALVYLISPLDAIPDFIPFAGLVDDAALIVAVVATLARELDRYMRQSMQASVETAERLAEIEVQKYNRIVRITLLGSIATALITIGLKLWLDSN